MELLLPVPCKKEVLSSGVQEEHGYLDTETRTRVLSVPSYLNIVLQVSLGLVFLYAFC